MTTAERLERAMLDVQAATDAMKEKREVLRKLLLELGAMHLAQRTDQQPSRTR